MIKNPEGRGYAGVQFLRDSFVSCVMLSGTPLDNTWFDSFALLSLLRGHPVTSPLRMRLAFTPHAESGNRSVPKAHYLTRITEMLDSVTLRRPASMIAHLLQPVTRKLLVIKLGEEDITNSNAAFEDWKNSLSSAKDGKKKKIGFRPSKDQASTNWASLVKAQQYANHPKLVEIMSYEREALVASIESDVNLDAVLDEEAEQVLANWRNSLREDENYRSTRIDAVIDIIDQHRDRRPHDAFLIVDESVFFLDILEIAISCMDPPIPCRRYDGRQGPAERHLTLESFRSQTDCRILLASRGTGGQGLNVQCANVLIRCGPWWKASWEEQAEGRCHRPGQQNPVFFYEIRASGCEVESHKVATRNRKNRTNTAIMNGITRMDGVQPRERFIS